MSEEPRNLDDQKPDELARGFDDKGFFMLRIHTDQGMEKIIGTLMTSIDMVKLWYVNKAQEKARANGILKANGMLKGFRDRWR